MGSSTTPWTASAPPRTLGTRCTAYQPVCIELNVLRWLTTHFNCVDTGRDGSSRLAVAHSVPTPVCLLRGQQCCPCR